MPPKKKRNPPDATFRNVNALKKRVLELELSVAYLSDLVHGAKPKRRKVSK